MEIELFDGGGRSFANVVRKCRGNLRGMSR